MRLAPPDLGVDIFSPSLGSAYQCKSDERGTLGSANSQNCIDSFERAIGAQSSLGWKKYFLALNAPITGLGLGKIYAFADTRNAPRPSILSPEYWSELCEKHSAIVQSYFDYRALCTEAEVIEAFRKARYYDNVILAAKEEITTSPTILRVSNNRTPLVIELPFGENLTIEKLLDVTQELMGISLKWSNFSDIGTSCGPSLSISVDGRSIPFKTRIGDLTEEDKSKLKLWIQLVWKDELQSDRSAQDGTTQYLQLDYLQSSKQTHGAMTSAQRGKLTIARTEAIIQDNIWKMFVGRQPDTDG